MDKCKTKLSYNVVPPPYTRNFMPPKSDLFYPSLDDFVEVNESVSEYIVEKPTVEINEPKNAMKENGAPIIEDWVSKSEEKYVTKSKTFEMFNKPSFAKINFVKSTEQIMNKLMEDLLPLEAIPKEGKLLGKTEFKNKVINQFCEMKGIKREFSIARTPQQNGVAKRKNRTLIETARTMLADSKLPTTFWDEAVNTACYVQNRVLVIKPQNKTPYELFLGRKPALSFMRLFGYPVTIFNTIDHLDALTKSMNYKSVVAGNQTNGNIGTKACDDACKARMETIPGKYYILLLLWTQDPQFSSSSKDSPDAGFKPSGKEEKKDAEELRNEDSKVPSIEEPREDQRVNQDMDASVNSTNTINTVSLTINDVGIEDNVVDENIVYGCVDDPNMPKLEDIVYSDDDEDVSAEADMNNLDAFMPVNPIPTTRIHKDLQLSKLLET
ncbi:ribonuclease H-like domain-containing protein [Tanacetum coccineum]